MISRTPMAVQPRQPQRALSTSSLAAQRPSHQQRTLSHQYVPSSPVRKEVFVDLTGDPADAAPARHGSASTPLKAGSRLKLELSSDRTAVGTPPALDSPQCSTPTRAISLPDAPDPGHASPALSRTNQHDPDLAPMPMPRRRPRATHHLPCTRKPRPPTTTAKKDARPKPYTLEVPPAAPRLASSQRHDPLSRGEAAQRDPFSKGLFSAYADFFPWSGNHHEDQWTAEAIQKGIWDKGTQSETSSARLAISPALKQKGGVSALSTIFMGILNQRRHRGQVTAPSTFKPPPRVTLTDTKREVWLKDLANPAISLRRLSRTIPHGIRGRTLLDQCLNKSVPTERAVWLAKCVGANEIRAFKRKGTTGAFVMGGELKWIRDWTVFVEQFVDSVVGSFGEPEWKSRVTYAIRLATNLYSEHLMDRDHYLDWIVSGLEGSPQSRIPMWILIAQIYWTDLLRSRKCGRRLAFALLGHLSTVAQDPDRDVLVRLSSQLAALLKSAMHDHAESFLCPALWMKYREALNPFLQADDRQTRAALNDINSRNLRLVVADVQPPFAGRQQLVKLLDTSAKILVDVDFSAKCWATCDDKAELLETLFAWAISPHRPGLAKVYVAAGLIRNWKSCRCDPTTAILGILDRVEPHDRSRKQLVYQLVSELVRSRDFSVSRYLQWLIARGGLSDAAQIDADDGPCCTRLLVELPVGSLSEKSRNERANLLRRAGGYSVALEDEDMSNALKCVKQTLGLPLPDGDPLSQRKPMGLRKLLRKIQMSNRALQCAIGSHIRDIFSYSLQSDVAFLLSISRFESVRSILEAAEDFAMLSEVLKMVTKSSDGDVLAACTDTVNANLGIFLAAAVADELFVGLVDRLKHTSQEQGVVPRPLLAALTNLAPRLRGREDIAKQLLQELVENDRNTALDACSPVSDSNLASAAQSSDGDVCDQIDKLLASGNTIDQPTMNRFFRNIVPKLEAGWGKADESRRIFASLLTRLRIFDMKHFDRLMADWVSHIRSWNGRPKLLDLYPLLVSLGCLPMHTLLSTATSSPWSDISAEGLSGGVHGSAVYLQELLELVLTDLAAEADLTAEEKYKFCIHQRAARSDCSKSLLALLRHAVVEYCGVKKMLADADLPLDHSACHNAVLETLKLSAVVDSAAVAEALNARSLSPEAVSLLGKFATEMLGPPGQSQSGTSFDQILGLANELTMPFCHVKLNLELSAQQSSSESAGGEAPSRFDLFAQAMDRAIEERNIMWTSMLPCLSEDITQHLKSQAHGRFLDLMPSLKSARLAEEASSQDRIHLAENLLCVVEAIMSGQTASKSAQLTTVLVEKLTDVWELVSSEDQDAVSIRPLLLKRWLPALLRFVIVQSSLPDGGIATPAPASHVPAASSGSGAAKPDAPPQPGHDAVRGRILLILSGLLLDLERLPPEAVGTLPRDVFDIAVLLVDALSEDARGECAKAIVLTPGSRPTLNTSSDLRLCYLFSAQRPSRADNLMLSHRERQNTPHSATVRGMGAMYGIGPAAQESLSPFALRRWELLSEPTPNVGENDTSLSLGLFGAVKL